MEQNVKFYVNPLTGRIIKSNKKTYAQLKNKGYIINKDKCLYNVKSAERCFNKLLRLYPNVAYPSSKFIDIPKTYKKGTIRAFIKDQKDTKVIGYIDKKGKKYKLKRPIYRRKKVPVVKDLDNNLEKIVDKLQEVSEQDQINAEQQYDYDKPIKKPEDISIIYNPLQDDFLPINEYLTNKQNANILKMINKELIPTQLPLISEKLTTDSVGIAGLIKDDEHILV